MTASLSSPYALVGEKTPSQAPHQKGLPPSAPHAVEAAIAPVAVKPVTKAAVKASKPLAVTNVPALLAEPVVVTKDAILVADTKDVTAVAL
jgi:hypothetical protein